MLNIATMGILKGNANPETPGGEKRPPKGGYVKYIPPRGVRTVRTIQIAKDMKQQSKFSYEA